MAASQCSIHLSRLAEEFVMGESAFGFVTIADSLSTGSSIMPQKNPDAAELVRGHSGRVMGCTTFNDYYERSVVSYSKDMQDDKPPVFEANELLMLSIHAMSGMVADSSFNRERMHQAAELGYATATDLADWLLENWIYHFEKPTT